MSEVAFARWRRLRSHPGLRDLVRETTLARQDLIAPFFVVAGENIAEPIAGMPGIFRYSPDRLLEPAAEIFSRGVGAVILFGIPQKKDAQGSSALDPQGPVPRALALLKKKLSDLCVITDVCLCAATDHGHCGLVGEAGAILNDPTLKMLAQTALVHAEAGADMVAPSDMMDGRVAAIRGLLDAKGFSHLPIMSYAVKYASAFYGPFRQAVGSTPQFGDRKGYQMDPANHREALREAISDQIEGADILMVKPAMAYLDIVAKVKEAINLPLCVYNVSGEYAMVKAAAQAGWIDEKQVVLELLTGMKRAGADMIVSYFASAIAAELD